MNKPLVARSFAGAFDTYDGSAVIQRIIAGEMIRLMHEAGFPEQAGIYEVGAGTGFLTRLILREFRPSRLVANDLCLEAAKPLDAISDQIEFVHGDAERLPVPNGCTNVVSCSAFQWFSDVGRFFRTISGGLSRGGYLAFSTFGPDNLKEMREISDVGLDYKTLSEHVALLEDSGFVVRHASETRETIALRNVMDLLRHIRETGTGGVVSEKWSVARTRRFCREYEERFSVDGGVSLTYHPMYFVAEKQWA